MPGRTRPANRDGWAADPLPAKGYCPGAYAVILHTQTVLIDDGARWPWISDGWKPLLAWQSVAQQLHQLFAAPPGQLESAGLVTPTTVLGMLVCLNLPFLVVFLLPRGYRDIGCLGMIVKFTIMMSGAVVLAYPAGMLLTPGAVAGPHHREVLLTAAAAPLVALGIAWWFSDFGPASLVRVLIRAGALLTVCVLAALVTEADLLLPGSTQGWTGIGAATLATLLCIATWRITDLHGPSGILKRAGFVLATCVGIGALARANHVPLVTSPATGSGAQLWITLLLAGLLLFVAALVTGAAVQQWDPRRLIREQVRPQPGEVWQAEFPFEDDDATKRRPVVVVRVHGDHADVCKITGTDLTRFGGIPLPLARWRGVLTKGSWLEAKLVALPYRKFYRRLGRCVPEVWTQLQTMDLPYRDQSPITRRIPAPRLLRWRSRLPARTPTDGAAQ